MMNGLGPIVLGIGSQDGLNPCIFMTCAVFIIHGFLFKKSSWGIFWLRIIFAMVYAFGFLLFNFGPGQIFVLQTNFILAAKITYFVLGLGAFVVGIVSLRDWFLITRGQSVEDPADKNVRSFPALVSLPMTVMLATVLSSFATLWPINTYFMILGNAAIHRAEWHTVISLLAVYVFVSMWPLWFVWAFLSIKMRPSWLKIFYASIFFTASTAMIILFKFNV